MPLASGSDHATISKNIDELTHNGSRPRSHAQIVAIALSNADRHPRADGGAVIERAVSLAHQAARKKMTGVPVDTEHGTVVKRDAGGSMPEIPYFERQEARDIASVHPGGLVASAGPGRTDTHNVNVAAGSYVLPADVVSGLGEGNTLAGARVTDLMLNSGPYGTKLPTAGRHGGVGIPHPPAPFTDELPSAVRFQPPHFKSGGSSEKSIPIVIAGGEYVVMPDQVTKLGGGDLSRGHRILDEFVLHVRKKTVKTLKKLPGPVK